MLGQIYLAKCKVNNCVYVGKHDGDIFKDNYFGSGLACGNVIKKYGYDFIERSILDTYTTKKEGDNKEKY